MGEDLQIVRHYTSTRRVPVVFGRFRDGTKLPGGPYTGLQAVAGVVVVIVANLTRPLWGTGLELLDLVVALGIGYGAAFGAGRIPAVKGRNPALLALGWVAAITAPPQGESRGRPLAPALARGRNRRRDVDAARATLGTPSAPPDPARVMPVIDPVDEISAPVDASTPQQQRRALGSSKPVPVTGVQRLLELTAKPKE